MNIKQQLPELNENQWKMLERAIIECLPANRDEGFGKLNPNIPDDMYIHNKGFNYAIDQATANIKQMMGQG